MDLVPQISLTDIALINGLNAVICGEPVACFCPSGVAIDEVDEHRYNLINVTDQLTSLYLVPWRTRERTEEPSRELIYPS
jgi:hypothetical protein